MIDTGWRWLVATSRGEYACISRRDNPIMKAGSGAGWICEGGWRTWNCYDFEAMTGFRPTSDKPMRIRIFITDPDSPADVLSVEQPSTLEAPVERLITLE
jgi:hypothetical protein